MPQYVGQQPWSDAAAYGAGLGQTLSRSMLQLPQERAQQAVQLGQLQQQQKQQQLIMLLAQARLAQQQQSAQSREGLEQKQGAYYDARTQALGQPKPTKEQPNKWVYDKNGDFFYNQATGEQKPNTIKPTGGLGQSGGGIPPAAQGADIKALGDTWQGLNRTAQYGMAHPEVQNPTNASYSQFSQATNMAPQILKLLMGLRGQQPMAAQPLQEAVTPGLGQSPTNQPPQAAPKVRRYNPATGQLE